MVYSPKPLNLHSNDSPCAMCFSTMILEAVVTLYPLDGAQAGSIITVAGNASLLVQLICVARLDADNLGLKVPFLCGRSFRNCHRIDGPDSTLNMGGFAALRKTAPQTQNPQQGRLPPHGDMHSTAMVNKIMNFCPTKQAEGVRAGPTALLC
jgi:hypothetical protein